MHEAHRGYRTFGEPRQSSRQCAYNRDSYLWRIPKDLVARGHDYDRLRSGGVDAQLHSHLPIDRQVEAIGAMWLDQTLVNGDAAIAHAGFGATVKEALRKRVDILVEHGFAQREGNQLKLPPNLLTALRQRDLDGVAKTITAETGMVHRQLVEGERIAGVYRRLVVTSSGRFAMVDDGMGFSLVPWRPVVEQRIGQHLAATVRGNDVVWNFGRQRGISRYNGVFRDSLHVILHRFMDRRFPGTTSHLPSSPKSLGSGHCASSEAIRVQRETAPPVTLLG
jgi:hypothetical protein